MKNKSRSAFDKYTIFLFIVVAIVYWKWWLPGLRVANDFPTIPLDDLKIQFDIPRVWFLRGAVGMGGYSVFTLWSWLLDFIVGALANFGLPFSILERLILLLPTLVIGVFSIRNLLIQFKLSKISVFVASLFYLTNTYLLLLIDGGQLAIGLAFAWFPAAYLLFEKSIEGSFMKKIIAGLGLWLLGISDIRFIYILALLLILRFFYGFTHLSKKEWTTWIWKWFKSGFVVTIIFVALNIYWIVPLVKYPLSSVRVSDLTKSSDLNFTQLKHSFSLLQPHWHENIFGKISPFKKEFLLIPLLAFLAPILKRKNNEVWFWTIVAALSVFLAKGANPPLANVYPWLFNNIPGFSLFRDSTKFFFLIALSYSVLISFTLDEIVKKFSKLKLFLSLLVVLYLLFLIRPVYLGGFTGTFSSPRYRNEYSELETKFNEDKNFGRIFWIPSRPPLGYATRSHSSLEANRFESIRPFAAATVGSFETQNFVREGNYMGELFDITGIRYLAYPYFDPKRDDMSKEKVDYYNTFLDQIGKLPWISEKVSDVPIPIFKTVENKDKFFLSANTYFVIGSDRVYSEIKSLGAKFSNNAFIFVEEGREHLNQINAIPESKIVLYDKNVIDLQMSFAAHDNFISPNALLTTSPNETGWWKRDAADLVWLRDFMQQKYGIDNLDFDYASGWAIAEGERSLKINNPLITKESILFARVMQSSRSGEVSFYQDSRLIGNIDTKVEKPEIVTIKLTGNNKVPDRFYKYNKSDFNWIKVGKILSDDSLTIKTKGDFNIINTLVVVSPEEETEIVQKADELVKAGRVIEWKKLNINEKKELLGGNNSAKISYQIIAPTHYKIKVEGLKEPTTLFFSETFDGGWELNSQKGYKLYSFINGFWINKDGTYDLYFTPQKYVVPGLIISIITLTSCIIILVWGKSKKSL